ncbi:MAG: cation:proton antiporter, partial [Candidatus Aminicenantes bacterium]|nr:cation:proton antiporter [Candidatus Aminicenantes bacterium]
MDFAILKQLVILLAAAVFIIYISHKIKIPSVVGFLLTGVLIGPGGLAVIKDTETISVLAEIGVIMLLFMIGIEFTLEGLKRIRRSFWAGGGLQVLLTVSAAVLILTLLKVPVKEAVFFGFLVSLSSTAIVLKILSDRDEIDAPQGRLALGILIFQDMAIVPMIVLVPILAGIRAASPAAILLRFLAGAAILAVLFLAARFFMPHLLRLVVGTRIREVFLFSALVICLGTAWLTSSLGLSLALGAFLAGVLISESNFSHQVVSDILPFKDVFNSLFFISIGMLLDTSVVWRSRLVIAAILFSILIIKASVVVLTARILGHSPRIALITGL